jgi:hypothetical protein
MHLEVFCSDIFLKYFFGGFFFFLFVHYSALLHLPPLRFHCADGCWDRTQDRCTIYVCDASHSLPFTCITGTRICKRLKSPGINSVDSIPPAYLVCRAGATNWVIVPARHLGNRFLGSLKGLQIRALTGGKS